MQERLSTRLLGVTILHIVIVLVFLKGFLLTRIELPDVSECSSQTCSGHQPYSKAVVLIVDALRYDFLCASSSSDSLYRGKLTKTLEHVAKAGPAAVAARFIADTPTITMSRLKALLTGGLPTFLDIGQSFSASALTEDNLLQQLLVQGKRLVVMGDDTWMQLAKDAFTEAYPYPSFDVHDLHTVDDGVWQHLVPLLSRPGSWDVLIAHYLGVDHAGHTYGVNSRQMSDKLEQMDQQISKVIETLLSQAGAGGVYEDTLLLVISDHGQTQGGDHGGGTQDETDSVLIAMSLRQMHQARQLPATSSNTSMWPSVGSSDVLGRLIAAGGYSDRESPAHLLQQFPQLTPGPWFCNSSMSQIDLTPLIAHLLGVAIPFGNLGRIPPHLYLALTAGGQSAGSGEQLEDVGNGEPHWLKQYADALTENAEQVHQYLTRYAKVGGLPTADLAAVNKRYDEMKQLRSKPGSNTSGSLTIGAAQALQQAATGHSTEEHVLAQLSFLTAAADLARKRFTLFQQGPLWIGCVLGVIMLVWQITFCWHAVCDLSPTNTSQLDMTRILMFTGLAAFHTLGLFSVGLLMGEGRLQCVLLAAATLLLLTAALRAVLHAKSPAAAAAPADPASQQQQVVDGAGMPATGAGKAGGTLHVVESSTERQLRHPQPGQQVVALNGMDWTSRMAVFRVVCAAGTMLACNIALQALGLIDRSGQDPHDKTQPSADLLMGPDAAVQRVLLLCSIVGPLVCILMATAWLDSWLQQALKVLSDDPPSLSSVLGSSILTAVKLFCTTSYVSIGTFWVAQLTGCNDLAPAPAVSVLWHQSARHVVPNGLQQLLASTLLWYKPVCMRLSFVLQQLIPAETCSLISSILELPLRLLLPRVVYVSALAAFAAVLLYMLVASGLHAFGCRSSKQNVMHGHVSKVTMLQNSCASMIHCQTLVWLCAVFAAALTMVLGYKGPITMLLSLLQGAGCCLLLRAYATASESTNCDRYLLGDAGLHSTQCTLKIDCRVLTVHCGHAGNVNLLGSGMWGMMGLQLFFCSSHFCEFSGLQYASAFIGYDNMVWYSSGSLLLLNTCGFLFLSCLTLPVMLVCCTVRVGRQQRTMLRQQLACSVFVMNSVRFAALVVSMVSAAVQQQHILLWAIFAPKLVFELFFMLMTDVGQLLAAFLAEHLLL